jgi:GT2 family glycosyltransferase
VLRLSIVIPVLGNSQQLDDTLVSVLENRPANCEVLVVHNEPYNDPYELAGEVQFIQAERKAGFAECLNLGLAACQAPVVHVLTCGVKVQAGWADAALRHFCNAEIGGVAALVLHRADNQKVVSTGLDYRADNQKVVSAGIDYRAEGSVLRIGQGETAETIVADQDDFHAPDTLAAFYRTSAVRTVGGFPTWTHGALAAVDMAMSLRHAGFRCVVEPACLTTADIAAARDERGFRHGRNSERLFWRWASSHGRVCSIAAHLALVAGECVIGLWRPLMLLQLFGRLIGAIVAALAQRRSEPKKADNAESPSILTSPHFDAAICQARRRAA